LKISSTATIAKEKIRDYLLKWQPDNDKSKFLELAGYRSKDWQRLVDDIRTQILPADAEIIRKTPYGDLFRIRNELNGPNGATLRVVTVWMQEYVSGETKFITLFPDKEK
jgi:hypothetical protein